MASNPGSINPNALEWYLEIDGKKVGPYSAEQILGLLREGEIPVNQMVFNHKVQSGWISVSDLQNQLYAHSFPPERPNDLLSSIKIDPPTRENDAANNLFDALILSKEKKQKQAEASREQIQSLEEAPGTLRRPLFTGKQAGLYGFVAILLGVAIWGIQVIWPSKGTEAAKPGSPATANPIKTLTAGEITQVDPAKDLEKERERLRQKEKELEKEREREREKIRQQQKEMEREREKRREEEERSHDRDRDRDHERERPADDFRDPEQLKKMEDGQLPPLPPDMPPLEPLPPEPPPDH